MIERIETRVTLRGTFDDAQRARLAQVAERCPVHKTLANGVQIFDSVPFEVSPETGERRTPTMDVASLRKTTDDKLAGSIRLILAFLFVMTGTMKLVVPMLAEAWSGQLLASGLPFYELSRWSVPFVEILAGIVLGVGLFVRPVAVVVIGIMVVATYVHIVVDDPSLFPLQPSEPIIPLAVIAMCLYLLWRGGGSWSKDLAATRVASR
jgi:uncharacterized membrane protein YphA (DoxX/SURF4 family)